MFLQISSKTQAEDDQYLLNCFYDANFLDQIINEKPLIISGRKGSGKTAIAKYLQSRHREYDLHYSYRISIDEMNSHNSIEKEENLEILLIYLITRTIQLMLNQNCFQKKYENYWIDYLSINGLQNIGNYKAFIENYKKKEALFNIKFLQGGGSKEYKRTEISNAANNLVNNFVESLYDYKKVIIFVDDITDYLDNAENIASLKNDINIIRDFLLRLNKINSHLNENNKELFFVACVRSDLFEFMEGSNINKLESNTFKLNWDEKSFCCLLIKRLSFYKDDLLNFLNDPFRSILKHFPNAIFDTKLKNLDIMQNTTKFYSYMLAISFNRPRDFLMYCYSLRDRLSSKHPSYTINIESAETEYSDYFLKEIKDELYLVSKLLNIKPDLDNIIKLFTYLADFNGFSYGQLKTEMGKYLQEKDTHSFITNFIKYLWWYGILGFRYQKSESINFRYLNRQKEYPIEKDLNKASFYLHYGILWALKKKRLP